MCGQLSISKYKTKFSGDSYLYRNYLLSWDIFSQYAQWNTSMKALPTLPAIDTYGQLYAADGSELCAFQSNGKPFGHGCIEMIPTTGPLFDLTVVADRYLYLLYKCGFMVAYFISGIG